MATHSPSLPTPQILVAVVPPITFPLSLSPTTASPSLPSTLKLSLLIFSTCAAPPTTVRLGSISARISYGLPPRDTRPPTFSYPPPSGLLNASEILRECTRMLSDQLWLPRRPLSGAGECLRPPPPFWCSAETGTGAGRGCTNCSYLGSGRSANCVDGEEASGRRLFHIRSASSRALARTFSCSSGVRPRMEMSSRRKLVGPDCGWEEGVVSLFVLESGELVGRGMDSLFGWLAALARRLLRTRRSS